MNTALTTLTFDLSELADVHQLIAKIGNQPVAISSREELIGYFVPASAVFDIEFAEATNDQVTEFLDGKLSNITHVLNYLEDK
ncbi:hypothetical protein ICV01_01520 [Polynucleobacter sp. MWH-Spelu-300-X4]|uniref:hypothetical protein n=1 Tax=Polynucleobacter sp. MWH-Spelu-300-X4 TaxID=2689109 RepID=UPI001BFDFC7B|nr:hypothetical protein [Polynucleobacter sp. MWH-Spelu-300-X4]QWD80025.1 hypothetical protein ICV01_01520 [Polynucleobacter sp. MWH-Spelu-300-X4]